MDWKKADAELNKYLRLQSSPVAQRLFKQREELPDSCRDKVGARGPMPVCQLVSIARHYGWSIAMERGDMTCPLGAMSLGFSQVKPEHLDGCAEVPAWVRTKEARARIMTNLPRLDYDQYRYIVAAPLVKADFEPQLILIYGNPAQMMRLVQSVIYMTGEPVVSSSLGAVGCTTYITRAIQTGECQMVVSGAGDRIFALTQDHEMSFTIPAAKMAGVLQGLAETAEHGMRYPTPSYLRFSPVLPTSYRDLMTEISSK